MTHLKRSRGVKCPFVRAIAYFDRYLGGLPVSERAQGRELRLRVPLASLGLPGELAVDRDVVTTFDPLTEPPGLEHGVNIAWTPVGNAALPAFRGSLRVAADTPKACALTLEGDYEPPLGSLGKVFDAAIGRKIAEATGDELLHTLAERIELDYVTEEPHISR